jgi:hypothetical protein
MPPCGDVDFPTHPSPEVVRRRLTAARERVERLLRSPPSDPRCLVSIGHAFDDLTDAERLLGQPDAETTPHLLRAVDTLIEVAVLRLRSAEAAGADST